VFFFTILCQFTFKVIRYGYQKITSVSSFIKHLVAAATFFDFIYFWFTQWCSSEYIRHTLFLLGVFVWDVSWSRLEACLQWSWVVMIVLRLKLVEEMCISPTGTRTHVLIYDCQISQKMGQKGHYNFQAILERSFKRAIFMRVNKIFIYKKSNSVGSY
jgi:hypothetical protein